MNLAFSPFSELVDVLVRAPSVASLLVAELAVPVVALFIGRRYRFGKYLYAAMLTANVVLVVTAFAVLLNLGPPAGLNPVGLALFLFLIYYLPAWIVTTLVFWGFLRIWRSATKHETDS